MDVFLLCLYVVLSCVGRGLCDGLITRPGEFYRVSDCMRDRRNPERGPMFQLGTYRKNELILLLIKLHIKSGESRALYSVIRIILIIPLQIPTNLELPLPKSSVNPGCRLANISARRLDAGYFEMIMERTVSQEKFLYFHC
jgi:hypothetical protein